MSKNKYNLPDFLIVGAAKAGTTAIAKFLDNLENVYIPKRKECRFFSEMKGDFNGPGDEYVNQRVIANINEYSALFDSKKENICGDVSPDYFFYYKQTIKNIKKYYKKDEEPKTIIVLRNPVDRAFSMYTHLKRDLREKESFEKGIELEGDRLKNNWEWVWFYKKGSMYYNAVEYFLDNLPTNKVKVFFYDDFVKDPKKFMIKIYDFLDINSTQDTNDYSRKFNVSGEIKNKFLQKLIVNRSFLKETITNLLSDKFKEKVKQNNIIKNRKESISLPLKIKLQKTFLLDIEKLERQLNVNLTNWKTNDQI
jgi:hypothetical protein